MKTKLKIPTADYTDLFIVVGNTFDELTEATKKDPKEILLYRLESCLKLSKRLFRNIETLALGSKIKMSFSQTEILTLRYCLMKRRTSPGLNQLFTIIDSKIHPNMYERS